MKKTSITLLYIKNTDKAGIELDFIKSMFAEYAAELNEDLCFQHFDEEMNNPLLKYTGPHGNLLLAYWNTEPAGCVALQPLKESGVCEMKRLYVKPGFRHHGMGDELVKQILITAAGIGYIKMVLDTLTRLTPAIRLYERHGFVNTSAYYANPLPGVVYMEKRL